MLFTITAPPGNERGPLYTEQALAAIHRANPRRHQITFAFGCHDQTVSLYCHVPASLPKNFLDPLTARYPGCGLHELAPTALDPPEGSKVYAAELRLRRDLFPIRRYPQFADEESGEAADPLTGILDTLAPDHDLRATVEILTRPARRRRARQARRSVERLASPFFRTHRRLARLYVETATTPLPLCLLARVLGLLAWGPRPLTRSDELTLSATHKHEREEDLQAASNKLDRHLFECRIRIRVVAPRDAPDLAREKLQSIASEFAQFSSERRAAFVLRRWRLPSLLRRRGFLLSDEELATLWHPPTKNVSAERMGTTQWRRLEPPAVLPSREKEPGVAELGRVCFGGRREVFGIRREDRFRHLLTVGKTGMGKSTLLLNMILSDLRAGQGVCLVDPHGDLAEAVAARVPRGRTNDVSLFDVSDRTYPLSFNPLALRSEAERPLVASGILSAFQKVFDLEQAPRLLHILRNTLLAVLETPGTTLLSLHQMLTDDRYRKRIVHRVTDGLVRDFWLKEFARWTPRYRNEALPAVQNKLGHFLSNPIIRNIVGQPGASLDLRRVMDEGRVLIVNLSKGKIGEDVSSLLGSLLVTSLQLAAMSRADVPEEKRRDFYLYVDEFQNFATESFATILSEARKYRLALVLAHQYLGQVDEETLSAVFGNVGTYVAFQVGAEDAEVVAQQLSNLDVTVEPTDVMALPRYTAYVRLLTDGMPSRPFSMQTRKPWPLRSRSRRLQTVRRFSRHRYARPVEQVERDVGRALVGV